MNKSIPTKDRRDRKWELHFGVKELVSKGKMTNTDKQILKHNKDMTSELNNKLAERQKG